MKKENFNKKEQAQHVNNLQVKCPDENNKFVMHCCSWFWQAATKVHSLVLWMHAISSWGSNQVDRSMVHGFGVYCFWACASYHLSHNTNLTLEVIGCMLWKIEGMQALYPQSYTFRWTVQNTTKVPNASLFKIVFMVELGAIGRLHQTSYLIVGYTQGIIDQFRMGSKFVTRFLIRFSQLLTLYKHSQAVKHQKMHSKMCWTNQYQIMLRQSTNR